MRSVLIIKGLKQAIVIIERTLMTVKTDKSIGFKAYYPAISSPNPFPQFKKVGKEDYLKTPPDRLSEIIKYKAYLNSKQEEYLAKCVVAMGCVGLLGVIEDIERGGVNGG